MRSEVLVVEKSGFQEAWQGPALTGNVPGIGGMIKGEIEDFEVEELPLYEPCGEGGHYYLWVEKRDVDGRGLVQAVGQSLGVRAAEIGQAGVKDKRAITRQWISVPEQSVKVGREPAVGLLAKGVEVLKVTRHKNKLRPGHLRGNRFRIVVRDAVLKGAELEEVLELVGRRIEAEGFPNYYGEQRFGQGGSTYEAGVKWAGGGGAPRDRFLRRMASSAVQSAVFNRVLGQRLRDGTWRTALEGDIFEKVDSGGRFWLDPDDAGERAEVQARLDRGEVVVTGPLPGSKGGLARGRVGELEVGVMEEMGLSEEGFARFGRQGRGARRALAVGAEGLRWAVDGNQVCFEFSLPAGSYATVLLREFMEPVLE